MTARVVLIGVGSPYRRDDGVGWVVAEAAARRLGADVEVRQSDGEPARLLDAWAGRELAVVIDAMRSGAEPGTIRLLEAGDESAAARSRVPLGSHSLGIRQAETLGRALDQLPQRLVVVGVEADDTGFGEGLSPRVASAVASAASLVARLVEAPVDG